jgi:perosamine synthetase
MIRLAQPHIPGVVLEELGRVLDSGMLTSGSRVAALEEKLSEWVGGGHVVLVSSGTTAALVAFHILHEQGYERVLMPDFCFPSVASSALRVGLEVCLVDIEPDRLNVAPESLPPLLDAGGTAVLASVDQFGIPGPGEALAKLAADRELAWFEDAACALGSRDESGALCGSRPTLAIFSFHPRKVLTTGEGGALVTSDPEVARVARSLRSLGLEGSGMVRSFTRQGYNARMSELHAAVGLAQIEILEELLARHRVLGATYLGALKALPGVVVPRGYALPGCAFQSLVVLLPSGADRAAVARRMSRQGVETTLPGFAIHTQPAFASLPRLTSLENSLTLHERGLALPLHEGMTQGDVTTVTCALKEALVVEEEE